MVTSHKRSELTACAVENAGEARQAGKYWVAASAVRLAGDLQGLTTSSAIGEAAVAFLSFLNGKQETVEADRLSGTYRKDF